LGLDSPVDHSILSVAVALTTTTPITRVVVLTHDAGLKLEISAQRRENGYRITTDPNDMLEANFSGQVADYILREHGIDGFKKLEGHCHGDWDW
jgi:hypothetical protein